MKEEKHSDKIFRDKLENYSVEPPVHIWSGIQDQLIKNRRNRRIVFLRWISAAAAIFLAFLGGWYFNRNTEISRTITTETSVVQPKENTAIEGNDPELKNIAPIQKDNEFIASTAEIKQTITETKKQPVASLKPEEQFYIASTEKKSGETIIFKLLEGRKPNLNAFRKPEIRSLKTKQISVPVDKLTEADRALIAGNSTNYQSINDESRWKFGMMISPGYSSQVANHTESYTRSMTYSANSGNANITGGISVQMKTGKRLSVESGVYYDKNGQKSEQSFQLFSMLKGNNEMYANPSADYFSNTVDIKDGNLAMNSQAGIIALDKIPGGAEISSDIETSVFGASNTLVTSGDLSQVFDFIQIPLYVRYKVIDSHFEVEMIGGLNAGVLVGNNAYIDNAYGLQNIGKTQDISPLSISGTLGIGLNYKLGTHFSLGAEPRFNYFLSSINDNPNVDFRPYRLGFYTGIYYEF